MPVDSPLTDVELASFPCAFSTAEGMIQRVGLGAERVLVTGASGGVGAAAVQLAKMRGAHVTAITSPSKKVALSELGADATLDRDETYPAEAFDVVLDLVGGPRWPELLDALDVRGRYVTSGAIAGPIVELDLRSLYLKDLTLIGCTRQDPRVFADLVSSIEAGAIRPVVADVYPLHELRAAQLAFLRKAHLGKIGIAIADRRGCHKAFRASWAASCRGVCRSSTCHFATTWYGWGGPVSRNSAAHSSGARVVDPTLQTRAMAGSAMM